MSKANNNNSLLLAGGVVAIGIGFMALTSPNPNNTSDENKATNQPADSKVESSDAKPDKQNEPARESVSVAEDQGKNERPNEAKSERPSQKMTYTAQSTQYSYVAQPGDSYSVLARKAVQTYGIINGVELSPAQIIAAETMLTQHSQVSLLAEGQEVKIMTADVKTYVEAAQQLNATSLAAWQAYVPCVDFDTSRYGEA